MGWDPVSRGPWRSDPDGDRYIITLAPRPGAGGEESRKVNRKYVFTLFMYVCPCPHPDAITYVPVRAAVVSGFENPAAFVHDSLCIKVRHSRFL